MTHQHRIRPAYLTTKKYGQIKNSNMKKLFKPQNFADSEVLLENKNEVLALKDKEKEKKKNKIPFEKILKWYEVKDCFHRLRFKDFQKKRQRALYLKNKEQAQMLKNNAIAQRIFQENPNRGKFFKVLLNIWKIKQSECFYQFYLKKLFRNEQNEEKMKNYNQNVQEGTKAYLKLYHPNLYDSGYDPMNTYNF